MHPNDSQSPMEGYERMFFVQQREASAQQCRLPPSVPAAEVTEDQTSQTYTHLYLFFTWKEPNHTHREQVRKQTATFFKLWPIEQFSFSLICTTAMMLGQLNRESTHRIISFKAAALSQGLRKKKNTDKKCWLTWKKRGVTDRCQCCQLMALAPQFQM